MTQPIFPLLFHYASTTVLCLRPSYPPFPTYASPLERLLHLLTIVLTRLADTSPHPLLPALTRSLTITRPLDSLTRPLHLYYLPYIL